MKRWLLLPLVVVMLLAAASPWRALERKTASKPQTRQALSGEPMRVGVARTGVASASLAPSTFAAAPTAASVGSSTGDLVYTRVAPCRIVDTRLAGGRLEAGVIRHFQASAPSFTDQGGANSNCAVLQDAPVVVLNVVAVLPDGTGFLRAFAYGDAMPATSILNYDSGSITANEVAVKMARGASYDFSVVAMHATDLVVDVAGYFAPPVATEPACETGYGDWVYLGHNESGTSNAVCASPGYTMVSGGCNWDHVNLVLVQYGQLVGHPDAQGGFTCVGDNPIESRLRFRAKVVCCRIPGR